MDGWVTEGKTDGEGTAKQQAQSSGLAAGQWQADRPPAEGLFHPAPSTPSVCEWQSPTEPGRQEVIPQERFTRKPSPRHTGGSHNHKGLWERTAGAHTARFPMGDG